MRIRTCVTIDASPATVWAEVHRIESHVEWMRDAESIRFVSASRTGVGTSFECRTRVGPVATTDLLVVTEWQPHHALGIAHRGAIRGQGRFTMDPEGDAQTRFCWREELRFPWWMGGPVGEALARPLLRRIWTGNLRRLRARVELG